MVCQQKEPLASFAPLDDASAASMMGQEAGWKYITIIETSTITLQQTWMSFATAVTCESMQRLAK